MQSIFKISYTLLFSLVVVLTFSCISQIVKITQEKYLAQECQKKINTISKEIFYITLQENENILPLREIEVMARERRFTDLGPVTYLKIPATEVVVR
jgi:hypothetical protein